MKPMRTKVFKAKLEKELDRYSRRIQKLASKAYEIRQILEGMNLGGDHAVRGHEENRAVGEAGNNAGEAGGSVRPGLQADGGEVERKPELDNVEQNPA